MNSRLSTASDLSNRDQMSVCIRYMDTNLKVWERSIEIRKTLEKEMKLLYTS